jgi:branched-chain amino acid transport system ATP-binding protein
LKERRSQRAGTMSGGERQMLAVGRALMSDPKLLMLDEPSLGLAPAVVESMYETFGRLHKQGLTILLAEQSIELALEVSISPPCCRSARACCPAPPPRLPRSAGAAR